MTTAVGRAQLLRLNFTLRQLTSGALPKVRLSTAPPAPVIPSKKPYKVEVISGKRFSWCSCGHSKKQPFCDGSHKTKAPGMSPLRVVPQEDAAVWLCGCKHTNTPPYCDGTHKQDFIATAQIHKDADS